MERWRKLYLQVFVTVLILPVVMCDVSPSGVDTSLFTQSESLGDCHTCKLLVESFKKGLERTARGSFEGGDAAWEEEKLKKSYRRSEMRLVDIQEGLCKDQMSHSVQCHLMAEKAEEFIEEFWSQDPDKSEDLHSFICIERLKVCCPKYHYGKDCNPCPGDHNNLCSGNGKCRGEGTRKGNGTCMCDNSYTGIKCDECAIGYYLSYKDDNKILCSQCHMSCIGGCRHGSQKDCYACKNGFSFDLDEGCLDINECDDLNTCSKDEFCLNSLGSYLCVKCDKSCNGCFGDGPDMCRRCSEGYVKRDDFCVPERDFEMESMEALTSARYMTCVGLLLATGILLQKSTFLGTLIGAMVLSYIIGAEYYCMINGHKGLVNLKELDLTPVFRDM